MVAIELVDEQITQIVIQELTYALELNLQPDEGSPVDIDKELVDSLKVTLRYFMLHSDWTQLMQEMALKEMTANSEKLDLYDEFLPKN